MTQRSLPQKFTQELHPELSLFSPSVTIGFYFSIVIFISDFKNIFNKLIIFRIIIFKLAPGRHQAELKRMWSEVILGAIASGIIVSKQISNLLSSELVS